MQQILRELHGIGLRFIDIGCRGDLDLSPRWHPLVPSMHYIGFDADPAEVARRERTAHPFLSRKLYPIAVAGGIGDATLYVAREPACSSLLRPRAEWNTRFLGASFDEIGQTTIPTTTLDRLAETDGLRADAIKIDSQGLEVPILQAAERLLPGLFAIEVETGLQANYWNETTFDKAAAFLLQRGFLPFDITLHRWRRPAAPPGVGRGQMMFAESLWLRDYLSDETWGIPAPSPDRPGAIRALTICWAGGFGDYGCELARLFARRGLITAGEEASLLTRDAWRGYPGEPGPGAHALRLLPRSMRQWLASASAATLEHGSLWASVGRRLGRRR
jgi:FkbM family methyltransferase